MNAGQPTARTRGGPLVLLVLLIGGWSAFRVMWWEDPFAPEASARGQPIAMAGTRIAGVPLPLVVAVPEPAPVPVTAPTLPLVVNRPGVASRSIDNDSLRRAERVAGLVGMTPPQPIPAARERAQGVAADPNSAPAAAPFLAPPVAPTAARPGGAAAGRWSLDAWAFWRQGSNAAPVSQGRVPIYGASQAGAVLQYRLAPGLARDPRLYARAYRALVRGGESELALGASLRPVPLLPLRAAGELRYTDTPFRDALRPAAFVVTEIPPLPLPYGARVEAYGQAGWVGGPGTTPFADGQASVTRELHAAARRTGDALHLSLGAAAWGGAQRDAQRLDIGPTLRLDMRLGAVPARLAVDWRARVAGDAAPGSGVAATLSAGF